MLSLVVGCPALYKTAEILTDYFQLDLVDGPAPSTDTWLYLTAERLALHHRHIEGGGIYVDFVQGRLGHRWRQEGQRHHPLSKAVGLKQGNDLTVVDATAGLGRDAFMLALLGCQVQMVERSPAIAALLYDGLQRAYQAPRLNAWLKTRLQLVYRDAQQWFVRSSPSWQPDVVYLDPMYPHRQKTALVKKEMRLCRAVVGEDSDAPTLLETALQYARQRVVVKRPRQAPTLNAISPNFCIKSKNTRFDVYLIQ